MLLHRLTQLLSVERLENVSNDPSRHNTAGSMRILPLLKDKGKGRGKDREVEVG